MDSITQAALGATIAGAVAGKHCNGKVLFAGAALGTLPDLDVLIDYGDIVSNTIKHRGFSHSLLVLLPFSLLLAWLSNKLINHEYWCFNKLLLLIASVLITHPLLDYFTTYGTQLTWPMTGYYARSSIFIIDPLYTVPLLVAIFVCWRAPNKGRLYCAGALCLSTLYVLWSLIAQQQIKQRVAINLTALGLSANPTLITPMPLNTLLWRIVILDGDQYLEGMASLLDDGQDIHFTRHQRGDWPIAEVPELLDQYQLFTRQFVSYRQEQDKLIVSDLRMGVTGNLAFQFQFAHKNENNEWQLQTPTSYQSIRIDIDLKKWFERIMGDSSITTLSKHEKLSGAVQ
ncbi:metal-dependent hydrolase [Thalassotalea maritima]|uniref:metal-dependent hydrolase n=1 Tax=Thalassotalea maritima TaxID=3242416 RepID=UPI003528B5B2